MNERIKELAQGNERILDFFQTGPVQRAAIEDFVEAIIRECADNVNFRKTGEVTSAGEIAISKAIKEHFGVEE